MILLFSRVIIASTILFLSMTHISNARPDAPPYAKWGQLAVKTAKEKYPNANIVDYLHIGREEKVKSSIEKFKLWLREGGKEFGLFIYIEFDPKNDRIIQISTRQSAT
ncbi:DUF3889 domain-containing protein [Cytobacillus depressus]|uniref:DUF3889 domain-containing protein n=1 Tax=Cytobacillus depressus TaxID=1602942 RepID=A0A6L3V2V7_9BACI|nr:YqzG/YhdC family protein [Cytobacillus depressus]KAB2333246.1 DUF3889 domain-containing protein [Cytobacillus depressus]